ncbi:hypothetical protein BDP27DRAFT_1374256 [Rhodocollybia butyracea]|uniref:Uncharacterized protein n=1 Tax=Rhodocollybia butyracea TaxID=206335 RepID=A0A9P5P5J1_9AGAR|nr:hypothetical protein BDP27DRAFT_1374256 [Rhodocollybia butyracea]
MHLKLSFVTAALATLAVAIPTGPPPAPAPAPLAEANEAGTRAPDHGYAALTNAANQDVQVGTVVTGISAPLYINLNSSTEISAYSILERKSLICKIKKRLCADVSVSPHVAATTMYRE